MVLPILGKYLLSGKTVNTEKFKISRLAERPAGPAGEKGPARDAGPLKRGRPLPGRPGEISPAAAFAPVERLGKNAWKHAFEAGRTRMQLEIPQFGLKANEAVALNLQVTVAKTKEVVGGITFLVAG